MCQCSTTLWCHGASETVALGSARPGRGALASLVQCGGMARAGGRRGWPGPGPQCGIIMTLSQWRRRDDREPETHRLAPLCQLPRLTVHRARLGWRPDVFHEPAMPQRQWDGGPGFSPAGWHGPRAGHLYHECRSARHGSRRRRRPARLARAWPAVGHHDHDHVSGAAVNTRRYLRVS